MFAPRVSKCSGNWRPTPTLTICPRRPTCNPPWETTIGVQRRENVHIHSGVSEAEFVALRQARDRTLGMPRLILPSVQVNMRAGHLPEPEDNGVCYLKIPLNAV